SRHQTCHHIQRDIFPVCASKHGRDRPTAGRNGRRSVRDGLSRGDVPGVEQDKRIPLPVKTVKRLGILLLRLGVHRAHSRSEKLERCCSQCPLSSAIWNRPAPDPWCCASCGSRPLVISQTQSSVISANAPSTSCWFHGSRKRSTNVS